MIWEELDQALIFSDMEAQDYQEVMKKLGGAFIENGYAHESYIDALIAREKEFPTGLDVNGIGVAIPHTDVSHVKKPGVAIAVLKQPVDFIQMGSDDDIVKVQLIFMLAVVDPSAHLERLQRILQVIQDTEVLEKLLKVKDQKQIIEIIKEKEREL
ncbi:PTS sugar transporter subunit IIA [Longibaculum muris]|uniref:PTS sugar transporter subunit IIA n=1 Tax=Longibaculum muris TaxID=1796628 RepID=UPI0012B75933|nr:PTS sugar transporter subunit IIA [Longibaculum muris]